MSEVSVSGAAAILSRGFTKMIRQVFIFLPSLSVIMHIYCNNLISI